MNVKILEKESGLSTNIELLQRISELEADNARLQRELESSVRHLAVAQTDFGTGLPMESLFRERLLSEAERCKEENRWLTVLFVDLGALKEVNNAFGHSVGDVLLKRLAGVLLRSVRANDMVARLHGDEFAVILMDADSKVSTRVTDRIKQVVATSRVSERSSDTGGEIQMMVAIGAVTARGIHVSEAMLNEAGEAVGRAKDDRNARGTTSAVVHRNLPA